jgi:DNA-formamidopyrimidine glycosylase
MPELPEVTTTVKGINKECRGYTIIDVWTDLAVATPSRKDFYETIKYLPYFKNFKKKVIGKKIIGAQRRGKNILINLENSSDTILIHMKMTGHMMVGNYDYNKKSNSWSVHKNEPNEALHDPYNRFVHVVFTLSTNPPNPLPQGEIAQKIKTNPKFKNEVPQHSEDKRVVNFEFVKNIQNPPNPFLQGENTETKHLVLCDSRKFAKVTLLENEDNHKKHLGGHGPEPLDIDGLNHITYTKFIHAINTAKGKTRAIKTLLMDTRTIAGIGNIYSDELLYLAAVHPESIWDKIPKENQKLIHKSMLKVLQNGIDFGGDSMSDYRNIYGQRGEFQNKHNVYQKKGDKCNFKKGSIKCTGTIERIFINGRSSHFCPVHQQLYK